ncbi:MTRF1L release factor glutamine methyltransferase [Malaya genurostris]|uniref:MTRF1L release factor glutamine methyltransferase n=1 Tax=Malaya genurostris TaxID=325434 RepID=UPI0026F3D4A0|nr:MTRF1L release factor glutamine methyltransferase [Malaya genurostris]
MLVVRSTSWLLKTRTNPITLLRQRICAEAPQPTTAAFTVGNVREKWKARFQTENIPEADTSILNILAHVLRLPSPADVRKSQDVVLNETQLVKVDELCECRLARMPIQYIIREWEFRDLTLKMVPPVFIPRPETEELVELILQQIPQKPMNFLEIGCGSGAVALSILKHAPQASGIAIDQSKLACELTLENARSLGLSENLRIFRHKVTDTLPEEIKERKFDMIVSNPPYVPSQQLLQLEPEIKVYEDMRALDGGPDGLTVIKAILEIAGRHLNVEGILWLEVDSSHPPLIEQFLEDKGPTLGLKYVCSYKDLFRKERFVEVSKV